MDWFIELLRPGNMSLASTVLLYSFVIFSGIILGKVKIFGVSLGVTFVLFVGILLGHFGYAVEGTTLHSYVNSGSFSSSFLSACRWVRDSSLPSKRVASG